MVEPFMEMTKKGVGFVWNKKMKQAFQEIKDRFTREPILYNYHNNRESIIETNASDTCKDNARANALSRPPGYEDDKTY
ncbi:hypothetical protein SS1G_03533 [Sclerotinia sclerotiorum 1980 UF-70]|uniref:Reverse transcriptase/retrotransposon-derived protein RNase H-like domain-containing protein n=1 Tax=Sclerotinia sclerotiorum (strain ATCC 18683 / 1980 / Ss-1) TaxID=665079 RepID=A7EDZ3_SCLS1|nr:hypothetical protein SS1G_03533 [Sclerotinia sclerotiorum 1980 UF-70]EDO01059.1 hypothetical protein SS1G_03533 [Sclerotinia sclerotiorum 1980 UF-70]